MADLLVAEFGFWETESLEASGAESRGLKNLIGVGGFSLIIFFYRKRKKSPKKLLHGVWLVFVAISIGVLAFACTSNFFPDVSSWQGD